MNLHTTKYPLVVAPASGATASILALTGKQAGDARRLTLCLRSSHISATDGLTVDVLLQGDGTTYRTLVSYTHPALTTPIPFVVYDIAVPPGLSGLQVNYVNSANTLTSWAGTLAILDDERASP